MEEELNESDLEYISWENFSKSDLKHIEKINKSISSFFSK